MAKAIRFHKQGGPEVLQLDDVAVGDPGPGRASIAAIAASGSATAITSRPTG